MAFLHFPKMQLRVRSLECRMDAVERDISALKAKIRDDNSSFYLQKTYEQGFNVCDEEKRHTPVFTNDPTAKALLILGHTDRANDKRYFPFANNRHRFKHTDEGFFFGQEEVMMLPDLDGDEKEGAVQIKFNVEDLDLTPDGFVDFCRIEELQFLAIENKANYFNLHERYNSILGHSKFSHFNFDIEFTLRTVDGTKTVIINKDEYDSVDFILDYNDVLRSKLETFDYDIIFDYLLTSNDIITNNSYKRFTRITSENSVDERDDDTINVEFAFITKRGYLRNLILEKLGIEDKLDVYEFKAKIINLETFVNVENESIITMNKIIDNYNALEDDYVYSNIALALDNYKQEVSTDEKELYNIRLTERLVKHFDLEDIDEENIFLNKPLFSGIAWFVNKEDIDFEIVSDYNGTTDDIRYITFEAKHLVIKDKKIEEVEADDLKLFKSTYEFDSHNYGYSFWQHGLLSVFLDDLDEYSFNPNSLLKPVRYIEIVENAPSLFNGNAEVNGQSKEDLVNIYKESFNKAITNLQGKEIFAQLAGYNKANKATDYKLLKNVYVSFKVNDENAMLYYRKPETIPGRASTSLTTNQLVFKEFSIFGSDEEDESPFDSDINVISRSIVEKWNNSYYKIDNVFVAVSSDTLVKTSIVDDDYNLSNVLGNYNNVSFRCLADKCAEAYVPKEVNNNCVEEEEPSEEINLGWSIQDPDME